MFSIVKRSVIVRLHATGEYKNNKETDTSTSVKSMQRRKARLVHIPPLIAHILEKPSGNPPNPYSGYMYGDVYGGNLRMELM